MVRLCIHREGDDAVPAGGKVHLVDDTVQAGGFFRRNVDENLLPLADRAADDAGVFRFEKLFPAGADGKQRQTDFMKTIPSCFS